MTGEFTQVCGTCLQHLGPDHAPHGRVRTTYRCDRCSQRHKIGTECPRTVAERRAELDRLAARVRAGYGLPSSIMGDSFPSARTYSWLVRNGLASDESFRGLVEALRPAAEREMSTIRRKAERAKAAEREMARTMWADQQEQAARPVPARETSGPATQGPDWPLLLVPVLLVIMLAAGYALVSALSGAPLPDFHSAGGGSW